VCFIAIKLEGLLLDRTLFFVARLFRARPPVCTQIELQGETRGEHARVIVLLPLEKRFAGTCALHFIMVRRRLYTIKHVNKSGKCKREQNREAMALETAYEQELQKVSDMRTGKRAGLTLSLASACVVCEFFFLL
jgi:hypothetical protein